LAIAGGSPIGNTALMAVEPGASVDTHFDTNDYWQNRVRVHVPIESEPNATFTCGQLGDAVTMHLEPEKAYIIDNHLAHSVFNGGATRRIHLAVDLVGSKRFWGLVRDGRKHGSGQRAARIAPIEIVADPMKSSCTIGSDDEGNGTCNADASSDQGDNLPPVVLEGWSDAVTIRKGSGGCTAVADAIVEAASPVLIHRAEGGQQKLELRQLVDAWCALVMRGAAARKQKQKQKKDTGKDADSQCKATLDRPGEVVLLQALAAHWECSKVAVNLEDRPASTVRDIVDAVAELHRADEVKKELRAVGGEHVER